jgi:hypothetical protein
LHWVSGKDALLSAVVEQVLADVAATGPVGDWSDQLLDLRCQLHRVFEASPGVGDRWLSNCDREHSAADRIFSEAMTLLRRGGLPEEAANAALVTVLAVATGYGPVARRFRNPVFGCAEATCAGGGASELRTMLEGLVAAFSRGGSRGRG